MSNLTPKSDSQVKLDPVIEGLKTLLSTHAEKRVVVVGTTCTGKSTMLRSISNARDQDKEVFPKLTKEEADFVCQMPWTEEIGDTMTRFVKERVLAKAGEPIFGTVIIPCDLIIFLRISDAALKERCEKRGVVFSDAKQMQLRIEKDARASGINLVEFEVG